MSDRDATVLSNTPGRPVMPRTAGLVTTLAAALTTSAVADIDLVRVTHNLSAGLCADDSVLVRLSGADGQGVWDETLSVTSPWFPTSGCSVTLRQHSYIDATEISAYSMNSVSSVNSVSFEAVNLMRVEFRISAPSSFALRGTLDVDDDGLGGLGGVIIYREDTPFREQILSRTIDRQGTLDLDEVVPLDAGEYELLVFGTTGNFGNPFGSGSANYDVTFRLIPTPSSAFAVALGVVLASRRKR